MDALNDPIGLINVLQKQNETLEHEVAILHNELKLARNFGVDLREILLYMRARSIVPLYLGAQAREDVLGEDFSSDIVQWNDSKSVSQVISEQIWLLEDAPLPSETKDALRNASKMGCERW